MEYSTEEKLRLECLKLDEEVKKLREEVKNIQRPFIRQPSTIWGAIPLLISVAFNFQQCSKTQNAEGLAKIELARATFNAQIAKHENDSLEKRKKELETNIALAKAQLQNAVDSFGKVSAQISLLAAATPSTPQTKEAIANIQQTVSNINQAGKYALANIDMKSSSYKQSAVKNEPLARQRWKDGFAALVNNNIEDAVTAFTESENAYNGYHHAYELSRYLRSKENNATDPATRKDIIRKVLSDYSGFAPKESIEALKKELNS